jgi:hypothetical protein
MLFFSLLCVFAIAAGSGFASGQVTEIFIFTAWVVTSLPFLKVFLIMSPFKLIKFLSNVTNHLESDRELIFVNSYVETSKLKKYIFKIH